MKNKRVAIIGYGWVGKAMHELFPDAFIYSRNMILHEGNWVKAQDNGVTWNDKKESYKKIVNQSDIVFICVPTPSMSNSILDTSIVEEMISWLNVNLIVVRSTVNPGDCDRWQIKYSRKIVMQPEYLGETPQHPLLDTAKTPFMIIGGEPDYRRELIDLYIKVYNANVTIRQTTLLEAEIIKLSENRAIAFKVAQAQELYDVCQKAHVDYYTIRDAVYGDDPRMNLWWTFVYPDNRGFNSKCIPKDIYAFCAWAESVGYEPYITKAILQKNNQWIHQK